MLRQTCVCLSYACAAAFPVLVYAAPDFLDYTKHRSTVLPAQHLYHGSFASVAPAIAASTLGVRGEVNVAELARLAC